MCHLPSKLPSKVRWSTRLKKNNKEKQLLLYSFTSEKKKNYTSLPSTSIHFCLDGMGKGKKKREVVLETELERGLEERCAKTSTSPNKLGLRWGRSGRRRGERERGMRGEEWSRRWGTSFFFLFPKSSNGHGRARIPRKVSHLNVNSLRQFRPTGSENPATQLWLREGGRSW